MILGWSADRRHCLFGHTIFDLRGLGGTLTRTRAGLASLAGLSGLAGGGLWSPFGVGFFLARCHFDESRRERFVGSEYEKVGVMEAETSEVKNV